MEPSPKQTIFWMQRSLSKYRKINITPCFLSDCIMKKLQINCMKKSKLSLHMEIEQPAYEQGVNHRINQGEKILINK